jgi:hypothetical protein
MDSTGIQLLVGAHQRGEQAARALKSSPAANRSNASSASPAWTSCSRWLTRPRLPGGSARLLGTCRAGRVSLGRRCKSTAEAIGAVSGADSPPAPASTDQSKALRALVRGSRPRRLHLSQTANSRGRRTRTSTGRAATGRGLTATRAAAARPPHSGSPPRPRARHRASRPATPRGIRVPRRISPVL